LKTNRVSVLDNVCGFHHAWRQDPALFRIVPPRAKWSGHHGLTFDELQTLVAFDLSDFSDGFAM
jgi:hypothetical protein